MLSIRAGKFWESCINDLFTDHYIVVVNCISELDVAQKLKFENAYCGFQNGSAFLNLFFSGTTYFENSEFFLNAKSATLYTRTVSPNHTLRRAYIIDNFSWNETQLSQLVTWRNLSREY